MFKFNSDNIIIGYLKQLLHDFNLPKYRVYTKEQEKYYNNYDKTLKEFIDKELIRLNWQAKQWEDIRKVNQEYLVTIEDSGEDTEIEFIETKIANINQRLLEITQTKAALRETAVDQFPRELNVLETTYNDVFISYPDTLTNDKTIKYPAKMRFFPYIKEGRIQEFCNGAWHSCHSSFDSYHNKLHSKGTDLKIQHYTYNQKIPNYTKNLRIQNNIYDTYTHEYLGDYLRFHRDFANVNLMPLYNCFSNRACPHLDIEFPLNKGSDVNSYKVKFNTDQSFESTLYKYYMVPVKLFQKYTITLQSEAAVEVCCCIYGAAQNTSEKFKDLPKLTYQCFSDIQFSQPKVYSKVVELSKVLTKDEFLEVAQYEHDLKLILKVPANTVSSIVILEGDYANCNDSLYTKKDYGKNTLGDLAILASEVTEARALNNHLVINLDSPEAIDLLNTKLITPLQLLRLNTGESYPFADRLLEYLVGNAITLNDEIEDNILRVKTVISEHCPNADIDTSNGVWNSILQALVYNYINKHCNTHDVNHDIIGFVDKDVEKFYSQQSNQTSTTISTVNIYK